MEINTVSTLVGLSRHPLSCLISRSPRSSSTLFFVFSFPFLSLPPFFLLFIISRWFVVSLVAALLLAPSSTGMQDYARARWISPRFVDRVTWTAFKFFEGLDWGGIFYFIAGLFPCCWEESCSSSKEPIFLFVRDNSGSMISRVSINFILDRMEEYRGILRNIEKKISNTFCEVNFKAMKRKKKSRNTKEWIIGRWINQLCKGEERGGIVAVGGNETERMKRFKGFCC